MTREFHRFFIPFCGLLFSMAVPPASALAVESKTFAFKIPGEPKPVVTVQAFADRQAISPGTPFNILVSMKMEGGWHTYWANPGAIGLPTRIDWKLPDGFEVGNTQFPPPEPTFDKAMKDWIFFVPNQALLVTTIRPPQNLSVGKSVEIEANVSWLVCKTECVLGNTEPALKLSLPVSAATDPVRLANEGIFKEAADALPIPADRAEHLKISARIEPTNPTVGGKLTAIIEADIAAGMHMQSHTPLDDMLVPAFVFVELQDGVELGEIEYPKPVIRQDAMLGKLSEYAGKVTFRVPMQLAKESGKTPRWVRGVFQYQICTDTGTCFAPQRVGFEIPVQFEGGPAPSAFQAPIVAAQGSDAVASADSTGGGASDSTATTAGSPAETSTDWFNRIQSWFLKKGYYGVILLAALGGFVLNFMPCVLPVISLKILSFVRQAHEHRARVFVLGLAYCAGILVFFGLIAWLFYVSGSGWGEHFQNPVVILLLAGVVTAFALSLFGVFTIFTPRVINELGHRAEAREGLSSAFFTGVLATTLGTACTAPFLSAAVGLATRYPPAQGAMIFMAVGCGMAAPFLLLAAFPAWLRFIPRPGAWMMTFETLMGFLLLGTVVWLLYPLGELIGPWGLVLALIWLIGVSIGAWIKGRMQYGDPPARKAALYILSAGVILLAWFIPFRAWYTIAELSNEKAEQERLIELAKTIELTGGQANGNTVAPWGLDRWKSPEKIPWVPYDENRVRAYVQAGYTVFVDFTATWCQSCNGNLNFVIDIEQTRKLMRDLNIIPFEADYSRQPTHLKKVLERFGRAGVPLYLVYSPNDPENPQILPELLTPGLVADAFKKAGPSRPLTDSSIAQRNP